MQFSIVDQQNFKFFNFLKPSRNLGQKTTRYTVLKTKL